MEKHLIVISVDALVYEDLEYAKGLVHFSRMLEQGSLIKRVRSTYPSLTHTAHATIMSGASPARTRVVNNTVFNPKDPHKGSSVWYNDLAQLGCETVFQAAKREGLSTASSSWPMTSGGGEYIDYLIPNALNEDFVGREDRPLEVFRALGAGENVMDIIKEGVRLFGWKNQHPEVDDFQTYCAAEIIKRYKPNLLLTHPSYVDSARHAGGVFGSHVEKALRETDRWLGILFDAVDEAGISDSTDFVILSDHGQVNITRVISPNVYLADAGYITLDEDGLISSWRAYAKSTGASAQVYLADREDHALHDGVYRLLCNMAQEGIYGFERVYTAEEAREKYGLYGDFSFVLEGDGYTGFGMHLVRPVVRGYDFSDYRLSKGTHGHDPDRGPQPTFIGMGPSFKKGVEVERGDLKDHAPTLSRVLRFSLPEAEGHAVEEILNL
ncbi:MAG: alkaline phosphatase family protein [Ruminococcaceae bacterium]|nr:alkaline phosphatase family protein [Oscillospiraceae bacterium]